MKQLKILSAAIAAAVLLVSIMPVRASAASQPLTTHIGTVSASSLRLRSGPSTSHSTLSYAAKGEYVNITGKSGAWYKVSYNLTDGYMHESYLVLHDAKNVELGYGKVSANKVNIRSGPGTSYTAIALGNTGDKAYIIIGLRVGGSV